MSILSQHINKMTYIGNLKMNGDNFEYTRAEGMKWKDLCCDMVYFMIVDGELMKIGKAGGKTGWNGRVGMYKNGITPRGDGTNKRMFRVLNENNLTDKTIEVYAVFTPPSEVKYECPLTGEVTVEYVPVHGNVERSLTAKYLKEGYELPFSNQLQ